MPTLISVRFFRWAIVASILLCGAVASGAEDDWVNPLAYQGKLDSPLVEVTPFVFQDRLYRLENWQKQWESTDYPHGSHFEQDEVRIRDMASERIVSVPLIGHGLGMALVDDGRVYVFAGNWGTEKKWQITQIEMVSSDDLVNWTEPVVVPEAEPHEKFFNVSVCRADDRFVMLVESNDPKWPAFTFKYFESKDLLEWTLIPDALYGEEMYVGGPALYYEGGLFYTLYLHSLGKGYYETRVTRSSDLVHWQDAPVSRPIATFNPENKVHRIRPSEIRETNASDVELCEWQGETLVYYTGGDQHQSGDLQWAEFDGSPRELLESFYEEPATTLPSARQLRYQENQLGAFVHFGPAAYFGVDGGGGDYMRVPTPELFNPSELDADQWMKTAKLFGAKHIVLTAKHHNGYCLWPTTTTDFSVKQSAWKDGKGDVVAEFVEAARDNGLSPGLYISAGDNYVGCHSTMAPRGEREVVGDVEAYFPVFMEQLRELLSNYGELEAVWFDGAYNPFDPDVLDASGEPIGRRYAGPIIEMLRELQPKAVIFGGWVDSDVRWAGSEQGKAPYPLLNVVAEGTGRENWLSLDASGWYAPESNIHTRRHWFWGPGTDSTLKTPEQLMDAYLSSIGVGANLLINLTPDTRGLVPDAEVSMLEAFGTELQRTFDEPKGSVSSEGRWEEGNTLILDLGQPTDVAFVVMEEDLRYGQRVSQYRVEIRVDGKWVPLVEGSSIGRKRIQGVGPITSQFLRLKILDTDPLPRIRTFAAY